MFILANMITCCLVLDEGSNLWPLPRLAEEVLLLGQHFQFLMTKLLPRTINLHAFISIYLSLDYLMSSGTAHGLIPVSGPFIPTIAPRNSFFFSLGKRGISIYWQLSFSLFVISFCAGVFSTAKRHALDALASGTLPHLFHSALCPLRSMVWWRSYDGEILWGFGMELSHLLFPSLYILLKDSSCSTFYIFNS